MTIVIVNYNDDKNGTWELKSWIMNKNKNKNFIDPIGLHSNIDSKFGASIFGKTKNK